MYNPVAFKKDDPAKLLDFIDDDKWHAWMLAKRVVEKGWIRSQRSEGLTVQ